MAISIYQLKIQEGGNINIYKPAIFIICILLSLHSFANNLNSKQTSPNKIIAAVPNNFPPYYSLGENGKPIGFAIDILKEISAISNITITYKIEDSWASVHTSLANKKADLIPNLGISQKRKEHYNFTIPIETFPISIFTRSSSTLIKNNSDLSEHRIGVVKNNVAVAVMQSRPDIETIVFENQHDALFSLLSSEIDALVYPKPVLLKFTRSIGVEEKIKIVGQPVLEVKRGIAIRKDNPELLMQLNIAIKKLLDLPRYRYLYIKWHGKPKPYWSTTRVSWLIGSLFILFLIIIGVWRYFSVMSHNRKLMRTISLKDLAEKSFKQSQSRMKTLLNTLPDLVWLKDREGVYLSCNYKFEGLYGHQEADIIGKTDYDFVSKELADFSRKNDKDIQSLGKPRVNEELVTFACDGHEEWLETIKAPVYDENDVLIGVLGVGRDITGRKEAERKITYQAHYDALTGLPNRFLSLDRLEYLIADGKRNKQLITQFFIDLDNFKKVNDSLGHEIGDKLLIEAAKRLTGLVREQDTVGRLGGDEFVVLIGGLTNLDDARTIAESILNNFRIPFIIDGRELILTLSLGVSVFPNDGDTASELLRKSDSAMYQSKSEGRNKYTFFTEEMNKNLARRLQLEEQLQNALKNGEVSVFYQPKIDLIKNEIMGAEALLRWNNPKLGNISPDEFIPLAEQMGAIVSLGEFVLDEALIKTKEWQNKFNKEFKIAVNISPRQFREHGLISLIDKLLNKHQLTPESLEVEITEGLLMTGEERVNKVLYALNEKGISIAMDDFGTGYSSLSYLRRYPFHVMKIDQIFVSDLFVDSDDKELVNAAIAMAHGLKLKVVAEGIETKEQLELLKKMGCDLGQGYFFSKPLPEQEFSQLFLNSHF